jgi:O-antigen ligase
MIMALQKEKILYFLLPLFCFTIPISTFGTTVSLLGIILFWLLTGDYQRKLGLFWHHPIVRVFFILMLGSFISLIYTDAESKEAFNGIKDSLRLGFIGVLLYYFSHERSEGLKKRCIQAFVFAMILTAVLSYLKYFFHLLPYKQGLTDAAVFKNHIKTSFFMTMAVYFMANEVRSRPKNLLLWIGIVLLSVNILFLSEGRIGYIIFGLLAMYYFWDLAKIRGVLVISGALVAILLVSQQFSLKIYDRLEQIPKDLEMFSVKQDVKTSSIGARLNFIETSSKLIQEKPWLGWGIGSFKQAYQTIALDENLQTNNPHNEYMRIVVEFGILGLVWLGYLIVTVSRYIKKIPQDQQFLIRGIWVAFLIGCLANSWLMDFSEGMFIVLILSMFLGKTHADNIVDHRHNIQLAPSA